MGIASFLLGENNPFAQWAGQNQNTLGAIGAGLGQGQNLQGGLAAGLAAVPQAKQLDQATAEKLKAEKLAENQMNATQNWLQSNHPDLAQMVQAGMPVSEAWQTAMQRMQPAQAENPYMSAGDGQFFNWQTGEYVTNPNATEEGPAPPSGYRWGSEGRLEFIPGGPHDPANAGAKPPTDADVRGAKLAGVIQGDKELLLGENGIYDKLADPWSQAVGAEVGVGGIGVGRPGLALTAPDYQSATNALTNIAQSYLYAISGQAAPAGEVAKIIESVTPKFGEDATSVKNKKARLASYIAAIEASKYDMPIGGAGGGDAELEGILTGLGI